MLLKRLSFFKPTLQLSSRIFISQLSTTPVFIHTMSAQESEFPPKALREIVAEVATLLKERKETVSVAETVMRNFKIPKQYLTRHRLPVESSPQASCRLLVLAEYIKADLQ